MQTSEHQRVSPIKLVKVQTLILCRNQVTIRTRWMQKMSEAAQSRRAYRYHMLLATTEWEKNRLRQERRRYTARRWYLANRESEIAKARVRDQERRQRQRKKCCPRQMLGRELGPDRGVKLWVTHCKTCHHIEYCEFGMDPQERVGVYFRGKWFKEINPDSGTGTTFSDEIILLK